MIQSGLWRLLSASKPADVPVQGAVSLPLCPAKDVPVRGVRPSFPKIPVRLWVTLHRCSARKLQSDAPDFYCLCSWPAACASFLWFLFRAPFVALCSSRFLRPLPLCSALLLSPLPSTPRLLLSPHHHLFTLLPRSLLAFAWPLQWLCWGRHSPSYSLRTHFARLWGTQTRFSFCVFASFFFVACAHFPFPFGRTLLCFAARSQAPRICMHFVTSAVMLQASLVPLVFSPLLSLRYACFGALISYVCSCSPLAPPATLPLPMLALYCVCCVCVGARTQAPKSYVHSLLCFRAHTQAPITYMLPLPCTHVSLTFACSLLYLAAQLPSPSFQPCQLLRFPACGFVRWCMHPCSSLLCMQFALFWSSHPSSHLQSTHVAFFLEHARSLSFSQLFSCSLFCVLWASPLFLLRVKLSCSCPLCTHFAMISGTYTRC